MGQVRRRQLSDIHRMLLQQSVLRTDVPGGKPVSDGLWCSDKSLARLSESFLSVWRFMVYLRRQHDTFSRMLREQSMQWSRLSFCGFATRCPPYSRRCRNVDVHSPVLGLNASSHQYIKFHDNCLDDINFYARTVIAQDKYGCHSRGCQCGWSGCAGGHRNRVLLLFATKKSKSSCKQLPFSTGTLARAQKLL